MIRTILPILLGATSSITLHAQEAKPLQAHKIPMIVDAAGVFHLCKVKVDGKEAHLLVDSGANMEVTMTKDWATAEGKEIKPSGRAADGIAGKAELFNTTFDSVDVGGAITLRGVTAMVMELKLDIPFAKQADGTLPKIDGLLGSRFLMNAQAVVNYADQSLDIPAKGMTGKEFLQQSAAAGKRVIPLFKGPGGAPYVPVLLGGKEFYFIIDNAAGGNLILPEIAAELGLELRDSENPVSGAGGRAGNAKMGIAENVVVGGAIKLPQFDFKCLPSPGGLGLPEGARYAGIIGNSFLKQLKVSLDFGSFHMVLPPLGKDDHGVEKRQVVPVRGADEAEAALEGIFKQHYQEIPLTKSKDGHYFVKVKINGKDRWMCLDSGADGILLDRTIAKEDGIELTEAGTASGADGQSKPSFRGTVETFSVGENSFNAAPLTFLDLSGFSGLDMPDGTKHASAGQLGLAYLRSLPIAVDLPKSRILVAKSNVQGGLAGLRAQTGDLTAPMVEDDKGRHYLVTETMGKKALYLVDLGSRSCILFEQAAKDLKLETRDLEGTFNTLGKRGIPRQGATLTELKLGDHKLPSTVDVVVLPGTGTEEVEGIPVIGIMGCMMFEQFRSTVDFHTNLITFPAELINGKP